ncbi:MAG: glycosyltransferase [bacterium]|nr:glycosyltransferase [bacterium]
MTATEMATATPDPVMFVFGRWHGCRPGGPPSSHLHNLVGSLASTGLAPAVHFATDELGTRGCDRAFYDRCHEVRPAVIVIGLSLGAAMFERSLPRVETLVRLRRELAVPVVAIVGNTSRAGFMDLANAYSPVVDVFDVWDNYEVYREQAVEPDKFTPTWTPQDPTLFHDPGRERDLDIVFVGDLESGPERAEVVEFLHGLGIRVQCFGGQNGDGLPIDEVAEIYQRARIVLNSAHVEGSILACHGRVFEATMCGALLLERENPHTGRWLDSRMDYAAYRNSEELALAARYFLEHEDLRRRIAARGHHKVTTTCTAERYWRRILSHAGRRAG